MHVENDCSTERLGLSEAIKWRASKGLQDLKWGLGDRKQETE